MVKTEYCLGMCKSGGRYGQTMKMCLVQGRRKRLSGTISEILNEKRNVITSNSNPKVKMLNKLNKDSKLRKEKDVFIVEGIRMFREIPIDSVKEVYMSESAFEQYRDENIVQKLCDDAEFAVMSDSVFAGVSQTKSPQGCLAVVRCRHYDMKDIMPDDKTLTYLVLDTIQDPGNMGTIFRSAEAAGVTALVLGPGSCDPYNPKVVRSTMGAIFRVPFVQSEDLVKSVEQLKQKGVLVYGAHLDGEELYDTVFSDKIAFLIGNEGNGLSDEVAATSDKLLRIPMEGKVESLNAAISATLLSYEAMRQRKSCK